MTERRVLTAGVGILVLGAVAVAVMSGTAGGFAYPFSEQVWALGFFAAGAVITRSTPKQVVGRLFMWVGFFAAVSGGVNQVAVSYPDVLERLASLGVWWWLLGTALFGQAYGYAIGLTILAIARFPDGEYASPLTKWLARGWLVSWGLQLLIWATQESEDGLNPVLEIWAENAWIETGISFFAAGFILPMILITFWSLFRSGPTHRRQAAWVATGALGMVIVGAVAGSLLPDPVSEPLASASQLLFPMSVVVAITRYKLYEIDRIVSRSVTYAAVLSFLAVMYFGGVYLLGSLLPFTSDLAVAASTLVAVGLSNPIRRRVQGFVDQRFFRSRYEAAGVLRSFSGHLRGPMDEGRLSAELATVLETTMHPDAVGVWIKGET